VKTGERESLWCLDVQLFDKGFVNSSGNTLIIVLLIKVKALFIGSDREIALLVHSGRIIPFGTILICQHADAGPLVRRHQGYLIL
jgi:hypothetical protein